MSKTWLHPGVLIEAEFHAVWESPEGELKDITPKPDGEIKILFIPDSKIVYEKKPVPNVRLVLNDSPQGKMMVEMAARVDALRANNNDGTGRSSFTLADVFGGGGSSPAKRTEKTGRNDPCPCGSGKKFKKCHGS